MRKRTMDGEIVGDDDEETEGGDGKHEGDKYNGDA